MNSVAKWIQSEPVFLLTLVQATIALVVSFGFHLTTEQIGAIIVFTCAVLGVITRQVVTPNSQVPPTPFVNSPTIQKGH